MTTGASTCGYLLREHRRDVCCPTHATLKTLRAPPTPPDFPLLRIDGIGDGDGGQTATYTLR